MSNCLETEHNKVIKIVTPLNNCHRIDIKEEEWYYSLEARNTRFNFSSV